MTTTNRSASRHDARGSAFTSRFPNRRGAFPAVGGPPWVAPLQLRASHPGTPGGGVISAGSARPSLAGITEAQLLRSRHTFEGLGPGSHVEILSAAGVWFSAIVEPFARFPLPTALRFCVKYGASMRSVALSLHELGHRVRYPTLPASMWQQLMPGGGVRSDAAAAAAITVARVYQSDPGPSVHAWVAKLADDGDVWWPGIGQTQAEMRPPTPTQTHGTGAQKEQERTVRKKAKKRRIQAPRINTATERAHRAQQERHRTTKYGAAYNQLAGEVSKATGEDDWRRCEALTSKRGAVTKEKVLASAIATIQGLKRERDQLLARRNRPLGHTERHRGRDEHPGGHQRTPVDDASLGVAAPVPRATAPPHTRVAAAATAEAFDHAASCSTVLPNARKRDTFAAVDFFVDFNEPHLCVLFPCAACRTSKRKVAAPIQLTHDRDGSSWRPLAASSPPTRILPSLAHTHTHTRTRRGIALVISESQASLSVVKCNAANAKAGIQAGDVIMTVNGSHFDDADAMLRALREAKRPLRIGFHSGCNGSNV